MHFLMVFDFTQFWLDGRPGNEYFWITHKISDLLTPLTPLGVRPQWFETDLSHSSYSDMTPTWFKNVPPGLRNVPPGLSPKLIGRHTLFALWSCDFITTLIKTAIAFTGFLSLLHSTRWEKSCSTFWFLNNP